MPSRRAAKPACIRKAPKTIGALCKVAGSHQPTARKAVARIEAMLDKAGIR